MVFRIFSTLTKPPPPLLVTQETCIRVLTLDIGRNFDTCCRLQDTSGFYVHVNNISRPEILSAPTRKRLRPKATHKARGDQDLCFKVLRESKGKKIRNFGSFPFVPPSTLCAPQLPSTCHYIVNHHVKLWHVRLGGGGGQTIWAH